MKPSALEERANALDLKLHKSRDVIKEEMIFLEINAPELERLLDLIVIENSQSNPDDE